MIPFYNLTALNKKYKAEFLESVSRVIDSGTYMIGKETRTFWIVRKIIHTNIWRI